MEPKYNHKKTEQALIDLWEESQLYAFDATSTKTRFTIDTPPPTVSGSLHIGHVFSYTHTDFIARYNRMLGKNVYYPMGFDDNGLPTERYVEKKHKTKAHILGRSNFVKLCQNEVQEAHERFAGLWKQLGLSIDWSTQYSTISEESRRMAQELFLDLLDKQAVSREKTAALYCPTCATSVAQAELDSIDQKTTFNTILFSDSAGNQYPIATTRPELLPACVAVLYHPDDQRFLHLKDNTLISPVFNKEVPCIADDMVEPDKGTGLVMCCTFGDQTDIAWQQKYQLPIIEIIDRYGKWKENAGQLAGLRVAQARKTVLELLDHAGLLTEQKKIAHAVSIHERCKQPIEYVIIPQWYVKILENKQAFLDRADQIGWFPGFMQSRYRDWVENLGWDWCISRQRFYGVPFPIWHCQSCAHVIRAELSDLPIDPQEQEYPGKACPQCQSNDILPETDVMDTWNISSTTPFIHANKIDLPMDLRPQAHDIIRTWAFYTIVKAHYHNNSLPWKQIMISGHVRTDSGKISKSTGGAKLTPEHLLENFSADAIRYWTAKGGLGVDTAFSEQQIKMGQRLVTKLWNAFRFIKQNTQLADDSHGERTPQSLVNKWITEKLDRTINRYHTCFEKLEYSHALDTLDSFFWSDFCDNYLELVKDQFFNPDNYTKQQCAETNNTLHTVGLQLLQLYGPFVPFVTESLYQELYANSNSLHATLLPNKKELPEQSTLPVMSKILDCISQVRKAKSEAHISLKTPIETLTVNTSDPELAAHISEEKQTICGVTKARELIVSVTASGATGLTELESGQISLTLSLDSDGEH